MLGRLWDRCATHLGRKTRREILQQQLADLRLTNKAGPLNTKENAQVVSIMEELAQITEDDVRYGGLP